MKIVTFTRDMRPHVVGEQRVVPDDMAARLVNEGAVQRNPPSFPVDPPRDAAVERQIHKTKRAR